LQIWCISAINKPLAIVLWMFFINPFLYINAKQHPEVVFPIRGKILKPRFQVAEKNPVKTRFVWF